jgi:hypothetical protein
MCDNPKMDSILYMCADQPNIKKISNDIMKSKDDSYDKTITEET